MGKFPLTHAQKGAIPDVSMARNIGPKMNIHAQDASFEAGIREAGMLGKVGGQIGDAISSGGAEIRDYVNQQKAKDDKANYIEAMDLINQDYEENFQKDALSKATDADTGKVVWSKYGDQFEGDKIAYSQNAYDQVQANDEVKAMVEKTINGQWGSTKNLSHVKFRVEAQQEQTNEIYTTKVAQAIQLQDAPTAIAMIKLRAQGSPEWQLTMNQDIRNASSAVWNNEQKAAIVNDPNNYDPSKMTDEEFPDYILDKDKAREGLVLHRKRVLRDVAIQDSVIASDKVEEIKTSFLKGDYGYSNLEEDRKMMDSRGKPVISAEVEISMRKNIKAAAEGKILGYDKIKLEKLRRDIYVLKPSDPDYKIKKAKLDGRKMTFPVTQIQMIDGEYTKATKNHEMYKKFKTSHPDLIDTFDTLMEDMKADFNVADLYKEDAVLAVFDKEKKGRIFQWQDDFRYVLSQQKSMQAYDQSRSQLMNWINTQKEPPTSADVINKFKEIRMPYDVKRKALEISQPINMTNEVTVLERRNINGRVAEKLSDGTIRYAK